MKSFFADDSFRENNTYKNSRKLKICFLVGRFPSISQTFILNQIVDVIRRGHNVVIYALQHGQDSDVHPEVVEYELLKKTSFMAEVPSSFLGRIRIVLSELFFSLYCFRFIALLMSPRQFGWNNIVPFRRFIYGVDLLRYIKKEKPDILHIHFGDNALVPAIAKDFGFPSDLKMVVTFHGYDLHNIKKHLYDKMFKTVDCITVNSNYSKNILVNLGCDEKKIVRLPVGLDCSVFSPVRNGIEVKNDEIRVIYIGRLTEFKGVLVAIKAFAEIVKRSDKRIYFDIIGDGELADAACALVNKLKIESVVVFHGALTRNSIIALMNKADIFLFPGVTAPNGRQENQGLVIQEAQAMELPVVVSDVGGVSEGLLDGESGYIVPEGAVNVIADKLELLIDGPELRHEMGRTGRKYVLENFEIEIIGNKLEQVYMESDYGR